MSSSPPSKRRRLNSTVDNEVIEQPNPKTIDRVFKTAEKNGKKKVALEETTQIILKFLQEKGTATFHDINESLEIPYRRSSDILNVLSTTPLVERGKGINASLSFCDGLKVKNPVNVATILQDIEYEKEKIAQLQEKQKKKEKNISDNTIPSIEKQCE